MVKHRFAKPASKGSKDVGASAKALLAVHRHSKYWRCVIVHRIRVDMQRIIWFLVAILIGVHLTAPVIDPDLWWHIVVGRWILSHHDVPHVDYWNMFAHGNPWRAYSWSNEIIYAAVDAVWGLAGLAWLKMAIAVGLAFAFQYIFSVMSGSFFVGCLLGALTVSGFIEHYTLRPQAVSWLLFGGVLLVSDRCARLGVTKGRCIFLVLLGCCWANTHLSAIIGLAGAFLWARQDSWSEESYKRPFIVTVSFFAGTLFSPYLGGEWLTLISKSDHVIQFREIVEFAPASIRDRCVAFILFQVVLLTILCFKHRLLPSLSRMVLAIGCVLAGASIVKFVPFAIVCLSAILARWIYDYHRLEIGSKSDDLLLFGLNRMQIRFAELQARTLQGIGFFLVCLIIVNVGRYKREYIDKEQHPWNAVQFLKDKHLSFPVINPFGSGGFVMYQFSSPEGNPIERVSIDGRTNINPMMIWDAHKQSATGARAWKDFIDLVKPRTILWKEDQPFSSLLRLSSDWCEVFDGEGQRDKFSVFITRGEFEQRMEEFYSADCARHS